MTKVAGGQDQMRRDEILELIRAQSGSRPIPDRIKIITDTTDFFQVNYQDVILLNGTPFWVKRYEKEGRFGLDDEPKYWVRRAIDLSDGSTKILKLVFHEEFVSKIGELSFLCFRSPRKESRILRLVAGHPNFMHGQAIPDQAGNEVRVLEFIPGPRLDELVAKHSNENHHLYFQQTFPGLLDLFITMTEAIEFLHRHGEKHGDIRRDHILWDRERQVGRWIDFDYNYRHGESMFGLDLQGLGNILIFLVGQGDVLVAELHREQRELFDTLWGEDLNISYHNRVANLKKIFPYIPESLNYILLHFSRGAKIFYDATSQLLDDLARARADLTTMTGS